MEVCSKCKAAVKLGRVTPHKKALLPQPGLSGAVAATVASHKSVILPPPGAVRDVMNGMTRYQKSILKLGFRGKVVEDRVT